MKTMFETERFDDRVTCVKTATEQGGNAIMWVYSYLVDKTLFDTGCGNAKEEFWTYAQEVGVDRVYVTHTHEDHVGACALLSQQATVFARENQIPILEDPPDVSEFFAYVWGTISKVSEVEVMPDQFSVGDLKFEVITLPGHSPDLMVGFYEKKHGWLFSADGVPLPSRKRIAMDDENVAQVVSTMEKIRDLNLKVLFDAHKGPIVNPQAHIQTRIDHLKDVQRESRTLHEDGRTIKEIVNHFNFEAPWYLEMTAGRFSIEHMIKSLLFDDP
ncbi:MAG: MBL fold metallo-hydrolase [Candidatus Thorarchaeota archaeon]|jgi:glyoxylase-like metal-dependent hydrolase (beta-lactamase superfamily II)